MSSKEYFQEYYRQNKERKAAQMRAYYRKHRDSILWQHHRAKRHLLPSVKETMRKYNAEHKELVTKIKLKSLFKNMYGLSPEQYHAMVAVQNNLCAICKQPETLRPRLSIDHDHVTDKVRGLLCHNCNVGLGHFRDSVTLMKTAIEYLQK